MSSYTSEKEPKAGRASDQSPENRDAIINAVDRTGDNHTCADHLPNRNHPYPRKYGAIFAQLAIKEQMVKEEKEKKKYRKEDERKAEEKKKMELDRDEKRQELVVDDDDDDDWEDIHSSEEDEGMIN